MFHGELYAGVSIDFNIFVILMECIGKGFFDNHYVKLYSVNPLVVKKELFMW